MSGTAPSDPAPGGHASDHGIHQTPLDANQYASPTARIVLTREDRTLIWMDRNILDETKDTHGTAAADRNVGETIDSTKHHHKGGISARVDDIVNKALGFGGASEAAERKSGEATERGFRVGEEADQHHLASSKQP
ncbi:hypothetical protein ColLi_05817 [Colletotrichum liriopes]|uniref:Uncharacterized protein n=1 Tax=Colletotrichum liriopes TaxID=708192 RepID=A0AA37GL16_9PEZI|nr:hypothetical protein ColLi_05817 [Colletotrichum liriopes]